MQNAELPTICRSVGCILAELLYRKPLFPGKDYIHQLKLIIKTLGSPTDEDLEFISIAKGRAFIKGLPRVQVLTLTLACCDAESGIRVPIPCTTIECPREQGAALKSAALHARADVVSQSDGDCISLVHARGWASQLGPTFVDWEQPIQALPGLQHCGAKR